MQAKSKIYLRQFEQENGTLDPVTPQEVMDWFKQQVITINVAGKFPLKLAIQLLELCEIKEIQHAKYGSYQYKVIHIDVKDDNLSKEFHISQQLQFWSSYENERPYRKTLILSLKAAIIFENSSTLYLINMATNEELHYHLPTSFSTPNNMFLSDQYIFLVKDKTVLWLYGFLADKNRFKHDRLTLFAHDNALSDTTPLMHFQDEDIQEVQFVKDPQSHIKFKTFLMEGKVIKICADAYHAIMIQHLSDKNDSAGTNESEEIKPTNEEQIKHTLSAQLSNMFRSLTNKDDDKNQQTVNILNFDLQQAKVYRDKIIMSDQISFIVKYSNVPNFSRIEVVMIYDSDNQKRLYIICRKIPQGFKLLEIEREVVTPLIDIQLNVIDWNFDHETQRLTLLYLDDKDKECTKVFPFQAMRRNATSHFGGQDSLNKIMDSIQESEINYRDQILNQLDGKVYPIQSYINYDNFVIIGHGNTVSYKILTNLCEKKQQWKHQFRNYEIFKSENSNYIAIDDFSKDIHYFFMTQNSLYVRFQDGKKNLFIIKENDIQIKDFFVMEQQTIAQVGEIIRVRELLAIKDQPYLIFDAQDEKTGEIFVCASKADGTKHITKVVFTLKLADQQNYAIIVDRKDSNLAIIYPDFMTIHKITGGKSDALATIQFKGALQDLDLECIASNHINQKYLYMLCKDILYIVNIFEGKAEAPQRIGTNVKHFLLFEDKYIYWLEKEDQLSRVKFDYFNPQVQTKLIDCELFVGANQLNSKQGQCFFIFDRQMIRFDETTKRMSILFSTNRIHLFPALHCNSLELIGYDKCNLHFHIYILIVSLAQEIEITHMEDKKFYLLNKDNCVKVWDIISSKMIQNKKSINVDYSSYCRKFTLLTQISIALQKLSNSHYILQKIYKDNKMGEYIAIQLKIEDGLFIIEERRKMLFLHSKCSEIRGSQGIAKFFSQLKLEKIKFAEDMEHFLAYTNKHGRNIFIIYKFINKKDGCGFDMYDAVTIINHEQEIFFSQNMTRFIEFDPQEQLFKIQSLNLDSFVMYNQREINQDYKESDYFTILSPSQHQRHRTPKNHFSSSASQNAADFKLFRGSTLFEGQKQQYIKKIMHENFKTVKINISLSSLQNRFHFMKGCTLSGNQHWPVVFCCDSTVSIITDNFIVKKYAINDKTDTLKEVCTIVDWSALYNKPQFTGPPPKFYAHKGILFTKDMILQMDKNNDQKHFKLMDMFKKKVGNVNVYPVNFDIDQLQTLEFCDDLTTKISEYMVREGKRYNKRKRIVFDFSLFNWYLVSKLKDIYKSVDIPFDVLKSACLSIYPKRQNILFYLNDTSLLNYVYNRMQVNYIQDGLEEDVLQNPLYIPFIKDQSGKTPLHYFLQNAKLTDQFLNYLADYPLNYYSNNIKELIPYLIIKGLQKTNYFLDKRFKQTPLMKTFDRERLKLNQERCFAFTGINTFWFDRKEDIAENCELFDENEFQLPTKLMVLDTPNIIDQTSKNQLNIFTALRTTEQLDIFESDAVRAIIEYAWPITRKAIIRWMMIPSMAFLAFFIIYTAMIFPINEYCEGYMQNVHTTKDTRGYCDYNFAVNGSSKVVIIIFLIYFLAIEIIQACKDARIYLSSPWNYLDIIAIIFVFTTIVFDYMSVRLSIQRPLYAFSSLIIWLKSLYYLRIFRNVGYLTSMIIQVIYDMVYFFIILVMSLFAFANSFYILSQSSTDHEDRFISSYAEGLTFTFRLLLGDFETQKFGDDNTFLIWILFMAASIFLIIVLLNLLISIISESYNRIQINAKNSMYKELASLIYDNYFLTNYEISSEKYIIIAKPDDDYIDDIIDERNNVQVKDNSKNHKADGDNEEETDSKTELIMENISRLSDEMSEIKQLLFQQNQQLLNQAQTLSLKRIHSDFQNDQMEMLDNVRNINMQRVSFGFGIRDSFIEDTTRRRRGTNMSHRAHKTTLHVPKNGSFNTQRARKDTVMRDKRLDIFS